jgi:hypothetical protein
MVMLFLTMQCYYFIIHCSGTFPSAKALPFFLKPAKQILDCLFFVAGFGPSMVGSVVRRDEPDVKPLVNAKHSFCCSVEDLENLKALWIPIAIKYCYLSVFC